MTGYHLLTTAFIFCVFFAKAETLKPFSEIRDAPGGMPIAAFDRSAFADCDSSRTLWKRSLVYLYFHPADVSGCSSVKRGITFYDSSGAVLGKTLEGITFYRECSTSGAFVMMQLIGYVHQNSIIDSSIVEFHLEKTIARYRSNLTLHEMRAHLEKFGYAKLPDDGLLTAYSYRESKVPSLQPGLRVLLIFHDNILIAVLYSRTIKVKNFEVELKHGNYNLLYIRKTREEIRNRISTHFLRGI